MEFDDIENGMEKREIIDGKAKLVFPDNHDCPVRNILPNLTSKWSIFVLLALSDGPERFKGLRNRVENISERMLSVTLQRLERDGLIARKAFAETPPRVEYSLTKLGEDAVQPIAELITWAERNKAPIDGARKGFDEIAS